MHPQKPISYTCTNYMYSTDFTEICDKSKQKALGLRKRCCLSVIEFSAQPQRMLHGVLGWRACGSEGQEAAAATASCGMWSPQWCHWVALWERWNLQPLLSSHHGAKLGARGCTHQWSITALKRMRCCGCAARGFVWFSSPAFCLPF